MFGKVLDVSVFFNEPVDGGRKTRVRIDSRGDEGTPPSMAFV